MRVLSAPVCLAAGTSPLDGFPAVPFLKPKRRLRLKLEWAADKMRGAIVADIHGSRGVNLTARPLPGLRIDCTALTGPANAAALHRTA